MTKQDIKADMIQKGFIPKTDTDMLLYASVQGIKIEAPVEPKPEPIPAEQAALMDRIQGKISPRRRAKRGSK